VAIPERTALSSEIVSRAGIARLRDSIGRSGRRRSQLPAVTVAAVLICEQRAALRRIGGRGGIHPALGNATGQFNRIGASKLKKTA
jgi:hypothetical protein